MTVRPLIILLIGVASAMCARAQTSCTMTRDTMTLPSTHQVVEGEYVTVPLKKGSQVTFFKSPDKMFLKLVVNENFYFDKVDVLEIRSGSKSYYAKDTRQHRVNKTTGLFVIEIYNNYLATLKDEGITSIVFNKAETDFTRSDASDIRRTARCFYDSFVRK
jgi:hypothetical protein